MSENKTCLDLFCGLGGFSAAFEQSDNWRVVTVDIDPDFNPDITADVMDLRPADLPEEPELVLASPPCEQFSLAASRYNHFSSDGEPQTEEARNSVALVYHTIGLIKSLNPEYWFLENPQGYLRTVLGKPAGRVTYCQYGMPYMKPTDLWGEHPPMTYKSCDYGDECHAFNTSGYEGGDGNFRGDWREEMDGHIRDPAARAKVPFELSKSIRESIRGDKGQQTLPL
jgi:site-specific DNA-cytosine methylase